MEVVRIGAMVVGFAVVAAVLTSALETVVLPRRGFTRIARIDFALWHRALVHRGTSAARRERRLSLFAPAALTTLPLVWMLTVIVGFAFVFWGLKTGKPQEAVSISGSSLTTLGFTKPPTVATSWLAFVEATIGLGLVALLISYLPTIYGVYNQREKGIVSLRPLAGTPPDPVHFLATAKRLDSLDGSDLWTTVSNWLLDLEQGHTSFPALCYFPVHTPNQSWVNSMGTVLEGASLVVSTVDADEPRAGAGAMLSLAYGIPGIVRIADAVGLPVGPITPPMDLLALPDGDVPAISITRPTFDRMLSDLAAAGLPAAAGADQSWERYRRLRSGYDAALRGLAGLTGAPPDPVTGAPARVGRPRLIGQRPLAVDWGGIEGGTRHDRRART